MASRAVRAGSINRNLGLERLKIVDFCLLAIRIAKELDLWKKKAFMNLRIGNLKILKMVAKSVVSL